MDIYTQEVEVNKKPTKFLLHLNRKEAQTLVDIVQTACEVDKRKSTFRKWRKQIESNLCCF